MTENSPVPPIHQSSDEQSTVAQSKKSSILRKFLDAFKARKPSDEDKSHGLYKEYGPYAESVKITVQMLIGILLAISLLVKFFADILRAIGNQVLHSLAMLSPLEIVAYGLLFSTGVDLAYMLFTDGPDEAIDPLMTGLAAAILLGIGGVENYTHVQLQQGITLILAVGALAGLFAIKRYLFDIHSPKK